MKPLVIFVITATIFYTSCAESGKSNFNDQAAADTIQKTSLPVTIPEDKVSLAKYDYEMVVPGLDIAWGMAFLPDGSMLITEKGGQLIHFKDGKKENIRGLPKIYDRGQGGLLDIALDPNYRDNNLIYITYASSEGEGLGGNTALMSTELDKDQLINTKVLYKASPNSVKGQHFGSRIAFDKEGKLYFSIGERGNRQQNPQDITRDGGKVYRIDRDGSIPKDNPFIDDNKAKKAIYTYGHRNPQGMILNPESGEIWVHEHGPKGGDEINVLKKGANYGWPEVTFGTNYDGTPITKKTIDPKFEAPIYYWLPSIAPSGFAFITSEKYPDLKGGLLVGSLKFRYLEHLVLEGKRVVAREKLLKDIGRVRNVVQAPDGYIYVSVEGQGILKLIPPKK